MMKRCWLNDKIELYRKHFTNILSFNKIKIISPLELHDLTHQQRSRQSY